MTTCQLEDVIIADDHPALFATVPPSASFLGLTSWHGRFLPDLHLNADEPATFMVWQVYLRDTPMVFILGLV
jgi:hypothetical protein